MDIIEALRRLVEGAEVGMSVCRRFGGCGREMDGIGGERAEEYCWLYVGEVAMISKAKDQ